MQKITKKKVEQNSVYKKYSLGVTADYSSPDGLLLRVGGAELPAMVGSLSGSLVDVFRGTGQHAEQLRFVNGGARSD
ncbi:MAG: hypothetical protein WCN98_04225 [Verrucomicrobiaceae bacterium]